MCRWQAKEDFTDQDCIDSFWHDAELGGRDPATCQDFVPAEKIELKVGCVGNGQYIVGGCPIVPQAMMEMNLAHRRDREGDCAL